MTLAMRLAKITERQSDQGLLSADWAAIQRKARFGSVSNADDLGRPRYEPFAFTPGARRVVFVDFCPGGSILNRRDVGWIQQGICAFESFASDEQRELFESLIIGDVLVMKKDLSVAGHMQIHAHGRVVGFDFADDGRRMLRVNWSHGRGHLDVPAMGVRKLISLPDAREVKKTMPLEFWRWLQK